MIPTFEVLNNHTQQPIRPFAEDWGAKNYKLGRALRVLQIGKFYAPVFGGMETHLKSLCEGLQPTVEVEAVVANKSPKDVTESVDGVSVTRLSSVMNISGASVCPGLVQKIRHCRADLLHFHLPNPTALIAWLVSGSSTPFVVTYHSDIVRQTFLGTAFKPILDYALKQSSAILVTSPEYCRTSPHLPRYADRCKVVPFGIEVEPYDNYDRAAAARIRQCYGDRIILAVGRLVYYKGLEFLVRAMANVDATLLIIGEGPLLATLKAEAAAAGVGERVKFLGRVDDTIPYYHACDIFAFPSVERSEAFGLVQLEAMACGKPVVNTSLASGVPWVSMHGITGFTVPPRNVGELVRFLNLLLSDGELCMRLGRAARRRVEDEFSRSLMLRRTLEAYVESITARMPTNLIRKSHQSVGASAPVFALAQTGQESLNTRESS